jgi:hypothetical protein
MKNYKLPQELESMHIIPAIRREYVRLMAERGMSQKEIAKKLGITEASVSHYVSEKRATKVTFDVKTLAEIRKTAEKIVGGRSPVNGTQKVCMLLRKNMLLCKISKKMGYAPRNCRVCYQN